MDVNVLRSYLDRAEVHRSVLRGYTGPYSLGVGRDPESAETVLILQVAGAPPRQFPDEVVVAGERVPVLVRTNFKAPTPLTS
jgi:hypothetical protein